MEETIKSGLVEKQALEETDLTLINRQALRRLKAEEVYAFRVAACDTREDRDHERFDAKALGTLAKLYVGRPILLDHNWSSTVQTARIYAGAVEEDGDAKRLVLRAYMLRTDQTLPVIAAIEGGILREVSVGCAMGKALCSVCGADKRVAFCEHRPGLDYEGKHCVVTLADARDAYEVSFVAVPAQPKAGVVKRYGGEENGPGPETAELDRQKALALLELEANRF